MGGVKFASQHENTPKKVFLERSRLFLCLHKHSKIPKNHVLQHIFINSLLVVKKFLSEPLLKTSQLAKMFKISNKKVVIMFGGVV